LGSDVGRDRRIDQFKGIDDGTAAERLGVEESSVEVEYDGFDSGGMDGGGAVVSCDCHYNGINFVFLGIRVVGEMQGLSLGVSRARQSIQRSEGATTNNIIFLM